MTNNIHKIITFFILTLSLISTGCFRVTVPDVEKISLSMAIEKLKEYHLKPGTISYTNSEDVKVGNVVEQVPGPGEKVRKGSSVNLMVSKGSVYVLVPYIIGIRLEEGIEIIKEVSLSIGTISEMFSDIYPSGYIISQDPSVGKKLLPGDKVNLVVSKGPEMVEVPNVMGLSENDAVTLITTARLKVGTITRQYSDTIEEGKVISQKPEAGKLVVVHSPVELVISQGKEPIPNPYNLKPISKERAEQISVYVRKAKIRSEEGDLVPIAWSMINQACQDRSLLLQYLIASTPDPIPETELILDPNELTETKIQQVIAQPYVDVASMNITGPLIVFQNLVSTNEIPFPDEPMHFYWPYHHAVAVNVEGNICIIDLSIQDVPIPIGEWTAKLTSETTCGEVSEEEYWEIWFYWVSLMSNWQVEETPEKLCGYTITPMLTFRSDQEPQVQGVKDALSTMVVQTYAFQSLVMDTYGIDVPIESVPFITSLYTPGTIDDLCSWVSYLFCQQE